MHPQAFLLACADLEQSIGNLYRRFAEQLERHEGAASLFLQLAEEEDGHAKSLQLVARLTREVKEGTTVRGDAENTVETMRRGLARADAILSGGKRVDVKDALGAAIRIEASVVEAHCPSFLETDSLELRSTIRMLETDTDQHKARLEGLLQKEMER